MNGMTLYQIDASIESILNGFELVDAETGEIIGAEALDALQMAREDKIENTGMYIKNQTVLIEALKKKRKPSRSAGKRMKASLKS